MIGPGVARFIKVTSHFTSHFSATEGPRTWSPPVRYIGQIERQHVSFIFHTPAVLEERGVGGRREGVWGSCSGGEIWSVHSKMLYIYNACPQQGLSNPPTIPAILTKATIGGPKTNRHKYCIQFPSVNTAVGNLSIVFYFLFYFPIDIRPLAGSRLPKNLRNL